ncbi:hypothetical protein EYR36_010692 [Pleurotus pulmonarius]|nr:hypothetical protein EYR36_010692 [Pleurotus pulmonarius]
MSRQELPLFTPLDFTFLVATTVDEADNFVQTLTASTVAPANVFGFDVELTSSRAVRLVQVASLEQAYVFDISLIGSSLLNFVENRDYIKIGVEILGDARTLPGASMRSGGELSRLHRTIDHSGALLSLPFASSVALSTLSERWIGRSLDKSLQKADWSRPLQTEHYTYLYYPPDYRV